MASTNPNSRSRSSLGRKPLGILLEQVAGARQDRQRDRQRRHRVPQHAAEQPPVHRTMRWNAPSDQRYSTPWCTSVGGRRNRLASIGVRVSETKPRNEHGHADGDGELAEQPAHQAAHEQHRDEHRRQRQRHRDDGEADLLRAVQGRLERRLAHLHVPDDVLEHDDGVVHHEARPTASGPSGTGCPGCSPGRTSTAKVPTIDIGSARLGMIVAERLRRNRKMTITTRPSVSRSVNCTSLAESWIGTLRSYRRRGRPRRAVARGSSAAGP